jgi:hypothetical protein
MYAVAEAIATIRFATKAVFVAPSFPRATNRIAQNGINPENNRK